MTRTLLSSLVALSVLAAGSAEAGTKKIRLDWNEMVPDGITAMTHLGNTLFVGDGAAGLVTIPIILPDDYKKNSTFSVKAHISIGQTGCNVLAVVAGATRSRPGKVASNLNFSDVGSGIAVVGALTKAAPATMGQVFSVESKFAKPSAGTITTQKAGDSVSVLFVRGGGDAADTCTDPMVVHGATLTYETN